MAQKKRICIFQLSNINHLANLFSDPSKHQGDGIYPGGVIHQVLSWVIGSRIVINYDSQGSWDRHMREIVTSLSMLWWSRGRRTFNRVSMRY